MDVYQINPVEDPRWTELVQHHPRASVFHDVKWIEALRLTYGYQPLGFTTSSPDSRLNNGIVFSLVRSWLTGQRLVSLPFSDHCEPLFDTNEDVSDVFRHLREQIHDNKCRYIEIRPVQNVSVPYADIAEFQVSRRYLLHRIDLGPSESELFKNCDKDSIQRRIRRAKRAGLVEECGTTETLLHDFYGLLILTRSRHHVPPQPFLWFQNLVKCFGDSLEIRLAYRDRQPVAAILTLRFKDIVYYKYGCSDKAFNNLGAMPFLLWESISRAKSTGAKEFDLGRTDEDNSGLLAFKDKWNARSQPLVYSRFPGHRSATNGEEWKLKVMKHVFAWLPDRVLAATGNMIYRHIG